VDSLDFQLLVALFGDAHQSYQSLGRRLSLSAPAVRNRLERLKIKGVLKSHSLLQGLGHYCKCRHWFLNLNRHLDCRCLQLHLCSRARHHYRRLRAHHHRSCQRAHHHQRSPRGSHNHRRPHFILFFTLSIFRKRERKNYGEKAKAWNRVSMIAYNMPNNNNSNGTWTNTIKGKAFRGNFLHEYTLKTCVILQNQNKILSSKISCISHNM
jgi:AsnC-type helix-turn-helix domain